MKTFFTLLIFGLIVTVSLPALADFPVRQSGNWDEGCIVAYNSTDHEYLVVWGELSPFGSLYIIGPVMGQRVNENGVLQGSAFTIFSSATLPSATYNSQTNEYLVVASSNGIWGQRVSSTGTLIPGAVQLMTEGAWPRILYNSLAGNYLLAGANLFETSPGSGSYNIQIFTRKIGVNGQPLGTSQQVEDTPYGAYRLGVSRFSLAYAPIQSPETPSGRYLLAVQTNLGLFLTMLDSDGAPIDVVYDPYHPGVKYRYIPFSEGSNLGGEFNVDVAYGTESGYSMQGPAFLVVWGDNNNYWHGEEWTGIWGGFVDPYKLDYRTDDPVQDNTFPISAIYAHWAYDIYAETWKPKVAFSNVGKKFMVAWRETPSTDQQNDTKVNHIRADKVFDGVSYAPNIVLSATSGNEDPMNPALATSTINPTALVVWEDYRNYAATNWDLYGNLCTILSAPSITVIQPNGQENWLVGSQHEIKWSCTSFTDPVRIEYSTDGGASYATIVSSTNNDGSYLWTVPNTPSQFCIVKISDTADSDPSDISDAVFTISRAAKTVTNVNDSGPGSLRQAILDANATAELDTIIFNIPGLGPHTIRPIGALPYITYPVFIDGFSQPGSSPNTIPIASGSNAVMKIELDGINASLGQNGLYITAGSSTVRGLVINRFITGYGILLQTNGSNVIEGNFIGTDITGTKSLSNESGVFISNVTNNTIGGTVPGARNVISGNTYGVRIQLATMNSVQGNFIGTDVTGTTALENLEGIYIAGSNNTIGGTVPGARNVISGNKDDGVNFFGTPTGNKVEGNFIGTQVDGASPLGNGGPGVAINDNATGNTIGGTTSGAGNTIAFNDGDGVFIRSDAGTGNRICLNSIFVNAGLGIDLEPDGVTPNDPGDGDAGPNNLQNYPVLTLIEDGGATFITGSLNSTPNTTFRLDFYSNAVADPSGFGEGQTHIGWIEVTTDGTGNVEFYVSIGTVVPGGHVITATATDPNGSTSEFSKSITSAAPMTLKVTNTDDSGPGSLRQALLDANLYSGADTIRFAIPTIDLRYNPNTGVWSIYPSSDLPTITNGPLLIDGFSQATYIGTDTNPEGPEIELKGTHVSNANGLRVQGCKKVEIFGLVINGFTEEGIWMDDVNGGRISGCYLGTDPTGSVAAGNGNGVHLSRSQDVHIIPAGTPAFRNVISSNKGDGIYISGSSYNTIVRGNMIGLDRTGTAKLGNTDDGISIEDRSGQTSVTENIIGGNENGVSIYNSSSNRVTNNSIGTDPTWQLDLGNVLPGVVLTGGSHGNWIQENCIGRNGGDGILVSDAATVNNCLSRNLISKNGGKGIKNTHSGNLEITPPANVYATPTQVTGTVGPQYSVEVFADEVDEGRYYLGSTVADASGNFVLALSSPPPLPFITATCADGDENTSEFSQAVVVVPVELTSFEAAVSEASVLLTWSTASETNNLGFEIQRSFDRANFLKIGFVTGHETTATPWSYTFTDRDLSVGRYYYRLKQIDTDGSFVYSPIVEAVVETPNTFELSQNYPNPFNPETVIHYSLPQSTRVLLQILDLTGKEVVSLVDDFQPAGYHAVNWNGSDRQGRKVASGVYIYRLQAGKEIQYHKLLLIR